MTSAGNSVPTFGSASGLDRVGPLLSLCLLLVQPCLLLAVDVLYAPCMPWPCQVPQANPAAHLWVPPGRPATTPTSSSATSCQRCVSFKMSLVIMSCQEQNKEQGAVDGIGKGHLCKLCTLCILFVPVRLSSHSRPGLLPLKVKALAHCQRAELEELGEVLAYLKAHQCWA